MSEADYSRLKKEMLNHKKNADYGFYRISLFKIGQKYLEAGSNETAYQYFLVCGYLDVNGPNNTSGKKI